MCVFLFRFLLPSCFFLFRGNVVIDWQVTTATGVHLAVVLEVHLAQENDDQVEDEDGEIIGDMCTVDFVEIMSPSVRVPFSKMSPIYSLSAI